MSDQQTPGALWAQMEEFKAERSRREGAEEAAKQHAQRAMESAERRRLVERSGLATTENLEEYIRLQGRTR